MTSNILKIVFIVLIAHCCHIAAQGSDGSSGSGLPLITVDTVRHPASRTIALFIFRSSRAEQKSPCVLFCPAYGADNPAEYIGFINHITANGAVVLFPTYEAQLFTRRTIEVGLRTDEIFALASKAVKNSIDTTRIGFVGHSYGAGIIPAISERILHRQHWGKNGSFLYLMSPWYFPGTSERELSHFPESAFVMVQVFRNDNINDPRIGYNFFKMLDLPYSHKEFCMVTGTAGKRVIYDFRVPLGAQSIGCADDAVDTLALYQTVDSLFSGVFKKSSSARDYLFGKNPSTRTMVLNSDSSLVMICSDTSQPELPKMPYVNSWISPRNPFVSVTRFRKARRNFVRFRKDKIRHLVNYTIDNSKKKSADDAESFEVLPNVIDSGFGADGAFVVRVDTIANPIVTNCPSYLFRPVGITKPAPCIILLHGYTGQEYRFFEPYLSHLVSRGNVVVYPTFPVLPVASSPGTVENKIAIVKHGIAACYAVGRGDIDTTRVGVQGHSFGGGMVPAISWHCFKEKGWGNSGAFMFITAPWYCHGITQEQLMSFPQHVKLVTMVFEDDRINDHQIAVDIYNNLNVPDDSKRYFTLVSDSIDGMVMNADHFVPYGTFYIYGQENLLDYYGLYRIGDALAAYAFSGDVSGRDNSLGNGDSLQCFMGLKEDGSTVRPCKVTTRPQAMNSEQDYFYGWSNPINVRAQLAK
jgi:dienelactone hydrolase